MRKQRFSTVHDITSDVAYGLTSHAFYDYTDGKMIDVPNDPSYYPQLTKECKTYVELAEVSTFPAFLDGVFLTHHGLVTPYGDIDLG